MTKIAPQPGIMDIKLYVSGESAVEGKSEVLKLSANENPYGFSDKARDAYTRAVQNLHRYPNTDHGPLRAAIAEVYGLDPARIVCGVGSDEVLQFVAQAYAGVGDEVIVTEHGFAMYPILAKAVGAVPIEVPEKDRRVDVDAILAAVTDKTKIVFIANPANPTGTFLSDQEVLTLVEGLRASVILVLDGAYTEFAEGYSGGVELTNDYPNVIMTRTFSKIYGLGGLRVGWGYGPRAVIDTLNRVRGPFNVSSAALAAAEAAVKDQAYADKCRRDNNRLRDWLSIALAEHGVPSDPSMTNFILARFASQSQAEACDEYLKSQGLIVRRVAGYNLPDCLRISVGDESACRRVAHAVGQFKAGVK